MASKRGKTKKISAFDIEAAGLVLLALGIFLLAMSLPAFPTGELGRVFRSSISARIGFGAYAFPWPPMILGACFMLRYSPKAWPRFLLGYSLTTFAAWLLLTLMMPVTAGAWGEALRALLTGVAGWLTYPVALFILSLGLELILALPPTRLVRSFAKACAAISRDALQGAMRLRQAAKARASFQADVSLARKALKVLDQDLVALRTLYPGSSELDSWRREVASEKKRLRSADEQILTDAEANITAWQDAVKGFAEDRAEELKAQLRSEGLADFDSWQRAHTAEVEEPIEASNAVGKRLDQLRKTLALDVTALAEKVRRLDRERDLAEASLAEAGPQQLVRIFDTHGERMKRYQQVMETQAQLDERLVLLPPWRYLVVTLEDLEDAFPDAEELADYSHTLAAELTHKGRGVLFQIDGWQRALRAVEGRLRAPAAEPQREMGDVLLDPDMLEPEVAEDEEDPFASGDVADAEADAPFEVTAVEGSPEGQADDEEQPAVGGIPLQLPSLELLDKPEVSNDDPATQAKEVKGRITKIDETLANFRLQGRVVASVRGPTVTRFEVEPAPGEKISRFANLSDDLALAMAVGSVRIEAPIPGKSVIGLEVPNTNRDLIRFREAAEAMSFRRHKARLPLIMGKSIDSEMVVTDLAKMPHLLIAGSTGSGKSVAVNTLVGSLLYKFLPTELRFLMIDPKMVELTPYDGIPHLLRPVVTNPADAAGVLLGAVAHMERRYKMMSKIGAKNLDQYNQKARNLDMPELPFIVIIIDELADLMVTSPKEVESAIMRLAQMARATGMHLVLATQRPSVDILTSLIKVNVPARVAFAVSSGHDSRTILDTMGAERLTGMGDMLFYQPGLTKPVRLQGPFISEDEIVTLSDFLRRQYFDDDFVEAYGSDFDPPMTEAEGAGMIDWNDDKLRDAAELVVQEGQASVSRLQRRLSVGHARAGKLMDSLEALAVVGPHVGSKPREVLVDMEDLPNIFGK